MRILVADDDAVYHSLLESLLAQWGYEPVFAWNGNEAWEILRQEDAPRLVILDWMMPGMDGYNVCRKVRQELLREDIYILILTSSCLKEDIIKVLVAGADDYLIKPFEPLDLKIHLRMAKRILDLQAELADAKRQLQGAAVGGSH
jgi:DNA-binding response OmpR family regulator